MSVVLTFYFVSVGFLAAIGVVAGYKTAAWRIADFLALAVPPVVWSLMVGHFPRGRSISNLYLEPVALAVAAGVCFYGRSTTGAGRPWARRFSSFLLQLVLVAAATYWLFPSLPE